MVILFVPKVRPEGGQRFDLLGAATLFVGLLSFLLALTLGQRLGFSEIPILILFALSVVFIFAFIWNERHCEQPMVNLNLFKNRQFSISLVTGFITFFAIAGTILLAPFYLENILRYNTRQVGFLLAAVPIAMGIIAPISGSLSDRFGSRPITIIGLFTLLLGYYAMSRMDSYTSSLDFVLRFMLVGAGMGIFSSPNNSLIMGTAPHKSLGVVSGMLAINRTVGQITGIAIMGAFWASRVFFYAGQTLDQGATSAPAGYQVSGLQDTLSGIVVIMLIALSLSIWGYFLTRHQPRSLAADSHD